MLGNFAECVGFTLLPGNDGQPFHETPGDHGGATAYGITRETLSRWMLHPASIDDLKALTPEKAKAIYQGFYWNTIAGDRLPAGIDLMTFDHGVVSGEGQSTRELQQVIGLPKEQIDGHVGPITLAKIDQFDPLDLITQIQLRQKMHYHMCNTASSFEGGWLARLDRRTTAAIAMLSGPGAARIA